MYDAEKLFKRLKRDFELFQKARAILDVMSLIKNTSSCYLTEIQEVYSQITFEVVTELDKLAPEFIKIGIHEKNGDVIISSKVLKRHFNSDAFMALMKRNSSIDKGGITKKLHLVEDNVHYETRDITKESYAGLMPTRNFISNFEVFRITPEYFRMLCEEYPSHDINKELGDIFSYLTNNILGRKESYNMKTFINKWLSGELIKISRRKKKASTISKKDFYQELQANGI